MDVIQEVMRNVSGNTSLIISLSYIIFVLLAILKSLNKRITKNIYNLMVVVLTLILVPICLKVLVGVVLDLPVVKDFISSLTAESSILKGASVAFIESTAIVIVSVVLMPILFVLIRLVLKIVLGIIILCIPPLKNLMRRKVDGEKVKITGLQRIAGIFIAIIAGTLTFYAFTGPAFSLVELSNGIYNEIPNEVYVELEAISNKNEEALEVDENEGEGAESLNLGGFVGSIGNFSKQLQPVTKSMPFEIYKATGIHKIVVSGLDKASSIEYTMDGVNLKTKGYSDLYNFGKGISIVGSYIVLDTNQSGTAENTISEAKFEEGIHNILGNNAIIEIFEPLIKDAIRSLSQDSFGLSEEQTQEVVDTIKLKEYIKMSESEKTIESKNISKMFLSIFDSLETIQEHGDEVLNYTDAFGAVLDGMNGTVSFNKTPGKLIYAFTHSNETIKKYLNEETMDKMILNVEAGKATYSAYLANVKASLNIAMTLANKDLSTGNNSNNDENKEEIKNVIKEDLNVIYNNSGDEIKDVMIEIIDKAVDEIDMDEGVEDLKNTIVTDYFDKLYDYADELKKEAGDDEQKQLENQQKFEEEAETITTLIDLVDDLNAEIKIETIEKLADTITTSEVLKSTAEELNKDTNQDAKQELQQKYNQVSISQKQEIKNMLDGKVAANPEVSDDIALLKALLGIS